jgi:hypothetical protein
MKDMHLFFQILFFTLKMRTIKFQLKKNIILYILHWKEISTSHVLNSKVMIIMNSNMNTRILFNIIMSKTSQIDSQIAQTVYIKTQEQFLNWMNVNIGKIHHFMSKFYDIDCFFEVEFNEENIFQASNEGKLQQEDLWVIYFIFEDCEVVDEQQKITLHFPTNVQQQFIFSTSP